MLNLLKQKTIKPYNYLRLLESKNGNIFVNNDNKSEMGETKHNLPASKEWLNSIYTYNKNNAKLFSSTDKLVNRLIKSYFNLAILKNNKKSSRIQIRFKRLSLNRILVSKAEIKHVNNKVIVNVYVYNRNKRFILFKLNTIYKTLLNKRVLNLKSYSNKSIIKISLLNYYSKNISKINKTCLLPPVTQSLQDSGEWRKATFIKKGLIRHISINKKTTKTSNVYNVNKLLLKKQNPILQFSGEEGKKHNVIKNINLFFYKLINFCNTFPIRNDISKTNYNEFSLENTQKIYKKNNYSFMMDKIGLITLKSLGVLKKARRHRRLILKSLRWNNESFKRYEIKCYRNYLSRLYRKEMLFLYYTQLLLINSNKFKSWFLLGIKSLISRIYNKKIELNFINLKYLHLNNDNFIESVNTKLKNRKNRLLKVLKKAMILVKIPSSKLHYYKNMDSLVNKNQKSTDANLALYKNKDVFSKLFLNNFSLKKSPKLNISDIEKFVIKTMKYKAVNGVRLEAAGRLSRRLTASRSVFKYKYKGSLKNIDSSYKNISSNMLRGYAKSNIQHTSISSKTRNGSFGLKGWISSY